MADPVVRLDSIRVFVEPGGQSQVVVTVTSSSSIVEGYTLNVLGAAARWAEVVPTSVSVYPGADATAVVVFSPPTGAAAPSGEFPFGVRARSTEDPNASAVAEGDLTLGKVSGLQAKIIPVTSAGRWRGRHVIQLSNWGNTPVQLQLVASDPDAALGFYLRPDLVDLPIGANATVRMTVRTRKAFLRGTPVRAPFQVIGEPANVTPGPRPSSPYGDPSRTVVDAALNQKPILSKTFVTVVALALVAAVVGGAYAFTRHPPPPTSLEQLGPPNKPKNFVVEATGPNAVKASWAPIAQVTGYKLLDIDPVAKVARDTLEVDGSLGQKAVDKLLPNTQYCYQLVALRDSQVSPPSELACARTEKAPATPTPTPADTASASASASASTSASTGGGSSSAPVVSTPPVLPGSASPTNGGSASPDPLAGGLWAVVGGVWPQATTPDTVAADRVKQLQDNGFPNALVVDSTRYPKFRLTPTSQPQPLWLAIVGPFLTNEAATTASAKVQALTKDTTFVVQPDPPG